MSRLSEIPLVLQIPAPRLPELHEAEICVTVSHVEEPDHFWCQRVDERSKRDYKHISSLIGVGGSKLDRLDPQMTVQTGNLVMGPFFGEYFRAKVLSVQNVGPGIQKVRLYFIDFGNAEEALVSQLRAIPCALLQFPPLAFECCLTGIAPSLISDPKGKWLPEATQWFKEATFEKILTAKVTL